MVGFPLQLVHCQLSSPHARPLQVVVYETSQRFMRRCMRRGWKLRPNPMLNSFKDSDAAGGNE